MNPVLETARLTLREMSLADLDFIAEMLAHPEVMRFWPKCYDRDEAADWVRRQQARYAKDGVGYWLILERVRGDLSAKPVYWSSRWTGPKRSGWDISFTGHSGEGVSPLRRRQAA